MEWNKHVIIIDDNSLLTITKYYKLVEKINPEEPDMGFKLDIYV